jgi:hypothetical protein
MQILILQSACSRLVLMQIYFYMRSPINSHKQKFECILTAFHQLIPKFFLKCTQALQCHTKGWQWMLNWEGCRKIKTSWSILRHKSYICLEGKRKTTRSSVMMAGFLAKNWMWSASYENVTFSYFNYGIIWCYIFISQEILLAKCRMNISDIESILFQTQWTATSF